MTSVRSYDCTRITRCSIVYLCVSGCVCACVCVLRAQNRRTISEHDVAQELLQYTHVRYTQYDAMTILYILQEKHHWRFSHKSPRNHRRQGRGGVSQREHIVFGEVHEPEDKNNGYPKKKKNNNNNNNIIMLLCWRRRPATKTRWKTADKTAAAAGRTIIRTPIYVSYIEVFTCRTCVCVCVT